MTTFTLCADTEDNHPNYVPGWEAVGSDYNSKHPKLRFDWMDYWDALAGLFMKRNMKITWMLRTDDVVRDELLLRFRPKIKEVLAKGDEIGIHIHTLVFDKIWIQTHDETQQAAIIKRAFERFEKSLGFRPKVSRMGWNTMTNAIMKALHDEGIATDASALPGYTMRGKRDNCMDWKGTPTSPYHPSNKDYRCNGNMNIIEFPISSIPAAQSKIWKLIRFEMLKKFIGNHNRIFRHFSPHTILTISPMWTSGHVKRIINYHTRRRTPSIIGYFHPCEVMDPQTGKVNMGYVKTLKDIMAYVHKKGLRPATLSEAAQ